MATWIKFDGSEEHKNLIINNNGNLRIKNKEGKICGSLYGAGYDKDIDSFLICEPHPHREMIIEWANTGRPVYFKNKETGKWELVGENPGWYRDYEYSFDPPKVKMRYRVELIEAPNGELATFSRDEGKQYLGNSKHVKWLTDWQEVEV